MVRVDVNSSQKPVEFIDLINQYSFLIPKLLKIVHYLLASCLHAGDDHLKDKSPPKTPPELFLLK